MNIIHKVKYVKPAKKDENPPNSYYKIVALAIRNFKAHKATEQDMKVLEDFYQRIALTSRALSIEDEQGTYPANYFVFMPVPLYLIRKALNDLTYSGFLADKDDAPVKKLMKQVTCPTGLFGYSFMVTPELSSINTRLELENKFKYRRSTKLDGTVLFDFTNEQKFEEFVEKTLAVFEKYNLPNTETCLTIVGTDIARGKSPINLKGMENALQKEQEKDRTK